MTTNKPEVFTFNSLSEECVRLSDYEALQAECEQLRKDAERYRRLRDKVENQDLVIAKVGSWSLESWSGDNPDAAIDAEKESEQ